MCKLSSERGDDANGLVCAALEQTCQVRVFSPKRYTLARSAHATMGIVSTLKKNFEHASLTLSMDISALGACARCCVRTNLARMSIVEETGALPPFCTKPREPGTVRKLKMSFTRIYQPLNVHWTGVHAIRDFVTHLPGKCVTKSPKGVAFACGTWRAVGP
jgi:hypothetical protein